MPVERGVETAQAARGLDGDVLAVLLGQDATLGPEPVFQRRQDLDRQPSKPGRPLEGGRPGIGAKG
jgi:hypothetical protein